MRRIILDTDVASLSIKQQLPPALLRHIVGAQVGITFVTLGELSRWATLRRWGATRREELDAWLGARPALPYSDHHPAPPPMIADSARKPTGHEGFRTHSMIAHSNRGS
jgi:hypothetical protein